MTKIILDTNIYRNLIRDKTAQEIENLENKIIEAAKNKSIVIQFPIIPAMELINHYNDSHPVEKDECRKSLQVLVKLSIETNPTDKISFTPPLDVILGNYFFNEEKDFLDMYSQIITLALKLTGNLEIKSDDKINDAIEKVSEQLDFEKENIKNNYENYLKSINEGNADWTYFNSKEKKAERKKFFESLHKGELSFVVAQSFVDRAYFHAKKQYEKNEKFYQTVIKFIQDFCPALIMNELLLEKIGSGVSAISDFTDKRWNTILDISLIFGTLYNPQNTLTKLVTEDQAIVDSFYICNFKDKVMKLTEFFKLLEIEL